MSKKGENIYKRKDGRWEARYIKEYDTEGKAKYGYCYGRQYKEVKIKLLTEKAKILENLTIKKNGIDLFSYYCDEWLKFKQINIKESTYVKYYMIINNHIKPNFQNVSVYNLNNIVVENFSRNLLLKECLSAKTVNDILTLLNSIFKYIRRNYPGLLKNIEIIKPKITKKEMRVLSKEEQRKLTDYLTKETDSGKFAVLLALMTGLRLGEICALKNSDISLRDKIVKVNSTMQRIKNFSDKKEKTKIIICEPKTYNAKRIIPLTNNALDLCKQFKTNNPNAFLLTGSEDIYMEPRNLQYKLYQYANECGISGIHFHTLRHSFATRCIEVNFEIKSLAEILGHSSPQITLERYVHSSMDLKRTNMNKLSVIGL